MGVRRRNFAHDPLMTCAMRTCPQGFPEAGEDFRGTSGRRLMLLLRERDNVEYEVKDLDHYYGFMGGPHGIL